MKKSIIARQAEKLLQKAVKEAILEHKRKGVPIVVRKIKDKRLSSLRSQMKD